MDADKSATYKTLEERYGVLMSYDALARVMNRSSDGLRLSLSSGRATEDWVIKVNQAKIRIGRRILFRSVQIAAWIDEQAHQ